MTKPGVSDLDATLAFAKNLVLEAAEIAREYYPLSRNRIVKADDTPVTKADIAINQLVIEKIKVEYPETGVLGEEACWNEHAENLWVCDPIDGTVAYMYHVPVSMIALALVANGEPVVGVAYNPWTRELYTAAKGRGAFLNDEPIKVSAKEWGNGLALSASADPIRNPEGIDKAGIIDELHAQHIYTVRPMGAIFKGCLIAQGSLDGRVAYNTYPHDLAATAILVTEAGGVVTDINGRPQRYDRATNGVIMSNGLIHEKLLAIAKQAEHAHPRH